MASETPRSARAAEDSSDRVEADSVCTGDMGWTFEPSFASNAGMDSNGGITTSLKPLVWSSENDADLAGPQGYSEYRSESDMDANGR